MTGLPVVDGSDLLGLTRAHFHGLPSWSISASKLHLRSAPVGIVMIIDGLECIV